MEESHLQEEKRDKIIEALLKREDTAQLKETLDAMHPADVAEAVIRMDPKDRTIVFDLLDTEKAAEMIVELDEQFRRNLLQEVDEKRLVEVLGAMDSDDVADVVGELKADLAERVLDAMPRKDLREVKTLLRHDEETAGGIMALEVVAVNESRTALEAQEALRKQAEEIEDVYNIYAVDTAGTLKGVVSLKELVLAKPDTQLSQIMDREPVSIQVEMDQEEVANIFHKYDLVSAPVVDEQGRLVGRITVDDVLDVVEEEASEDITMMAGITDEAIRFPSIFRVSSVRLPWLLVAFVGEMISAAVMMRFEASFTETFVAAIFIPLIMAMGGNMGIQSSTVVIRGLATGDIHLRDTGPRLVREISVALLNGLIIVIVLLGFVTIWTYLPILGKVLDTRAFGLIHGVPVFGMVLGCALLIVLLNAAFMGTLLPFLFKRIGFDPAIATGPFITTSNDVLGLVVYFITLSLSLNWIA